MMGQDGNHKISTTQKGVDGMPEGWGWRRSDVTPDDNDRTLETAATAENGPPV